MNNRIVIIFVDIIFIFNYITITYRSIVIGTIRGRISATCCPWREYR